MKKFAVIIFLSVFALMLLGVVMVLTSSSTYSGFKFDDVFHLFNSHIFKVALGLVVLFLFSVIPYDVYKEWSKELIILITLVLLFTLLFSSEVKGAGRWINVGFFTFQPADIAKLILIIHLAALIEDKGEILQNYKHGFLYPLFWILLVCGLIFLQPNVSNAVILLLIGFSMLYVGEAKFKHIFSSLAFCFLFAASAAMTFSHSRARILAFIDSFQSGESINFQVRQAILGLGSGGLFGVGIGNGNQSNLFLPESYGDFIFAVLGEELGFVGALLVLLLYLFLFFLGVLIAKKVKDTFGQLLAFGISLTFLIYAYVNASVATGLLPTTGLPLPFISYGGTSVVFLSMSVGILINIAVLNSSVESKKDIVTQKDYGSLNKV